MMRIWIIWSSGVLLQKLFRERLCNLLSLLVLIVPMMGCVIGLWGWLKGRCWRQFRGGACLQLLSMQYGMSVTSESLSTRWGRSELWSTGLCLWSKTETELAWIVFLILLVANSMSGYIMRLRTLFWFWVLPIFIAQVSEYIVSVLWLFDINKTIQETSIILFKKVKIMICWET